MIKINKAKNVFGISSLNGANTLDKLNVIYAPNGTAKSSIADAIKNISIGEPVDDVYGNSPAPSYELEIDGSVYNETNMISFSVLKYCGVESFELNEGGDYSNLVVSPSAKASLAASIVSINNSLNAIDNILLSSFKKKGKGKGQKFSSGLIDSMSIVAGTRDNITLNFALNFKTSIKPLSETISEDDVLLLASQKGMELINKPEVSSSVANYASIINKKTIGTIIDSGFDIDKLNEFKNHIIGDSYFDDAKQRMLSIKGRTIDKDQFLIMVEEENKNIYGTEDVKKELDKCKDAMNKNVGFTKFSSGLLSKPSLIRHALDYVTFANELFVTFLGPVCVLKIESEIANIKKEQAHIASMRSSFSGDDNILHGIWEKFKSRFKFNKYDLDIKNKFDAITGNELPRFIKCKPGTNDEITDPSALRFSTGEIRSYNFINFIIEVEKMLISNNRFTIVLDDAVDSFDYKNKYGIIDYLNDIKNKPNVQIIILTHNFDFYRSAILSLGKSNTNQYFMYKDKIGVVTLHNVKTKGYYLSVTDFNSWKNSGDGVKYLSFIPFLRNILQLETCSQDKKVQDVDKYLHYEIGVSETLDFSIIEPLMKGLNFALPHSMNTTDIYMDTLDQIALTISSTHINETDLENKLVLGLYIRLFLERFLSERIKKRSGSAPNIGNIFAKTSSLINDANRSGYLSDDELAIAIEANVVSPSYVHANSFMYEPLIDVDSLTLVDIANKIRTINQAI